MRCTPSTTIQSHEAAPPFSCTAETSSTASLRLTAELKDDREALSRKLTLLRRSGLFGDDTKGAIVERACSAQDLRDAYRLVHSVFLGTGYIGAEPAGMRLRIFEMSSETSTFVAKVDGRVVGVLSVVGDSPDLGLPSDSAFKPELDAMRATGVRICEVTNQAVAEEFRRSAVPTELMRCATALALHAGYDEAIVAVSPSHRGFYDLLGFRKLGSERSYSRKLHDPVIALCAGLHQYRETPAGAAGLEEFVRHYMTASNPFFERLTEWSRQARRSFLNPDLLEELFVKERNFLAECSGAELRVLQKRWGQELFGLVSGSDTFRVADEVREQPSTLPATHELKRSEIPSDRATRERVDDSPISLGNLFAFARSQLTKLLQRKQGRPQKTGLAPANGALEQDDLPLEWLLADGAPSEINPR